MKFGRITKEYTEAAARLEAACLDTAWSRQQIEDATDREDTLYLVATENSRLCAIASCVFSAFEAMVENVATDLEFRRRGAAAVLMQLLEEEAVRRGLERLCLEVATRNDSAVALYEKAGYEIKGIRKNFYPKQKDDAFVMVKEIIG